MKGICASFALVFFALINAHSSPETKVTVCNGSAFLCAKRYNEVAYPAAHNAQSHKESSVANQDLPLPQQLEHGIRAIKIHVWPSKGADGKEVASVCHGASKSLFEKDYLEMVIEKIPRIVRSFARDLVAKIEPLNQLVRDAFRYAYGTNDDERGKIPFNHCIFDPAQRPLVECLKEVNTFMESHPNEVLTIILEDHTDRLEDLDRALHDSGLKRFAHHQKKEVPWPTLGEMLTSGKRLVVFVHGKETLPYKSHPELLYIWDFCWDTEWDFQEADDLKNCCKDIVPKRGEMAYALRNKEPKNTIFIVHHFVTDGPGGSKSSAKKVNRKAFLQARLERLQAHTGHIPNIIQVDFCEQPNNDLFEVVAEFNTK